MKTNKPFQISPETPLQKSWSGEPDPDGGVLYDPIVVLDEFAKSESRVHVNRAELREAMLQAQQRGDVAIKPNDFPLFDRGIVRKALLQRLYPDGWTGPRDPQGRRLDGVPFRKAIDPVKAAYAAHASDPSTTVEDLERAAAELDALAARLNGR